ncbi:MAG: HAD family hydrolase [Pseudomonadota bacterium]
MLDAILFDLDNTLILFDETEFYQGYFHRITPLFSDVIPPDEFRDRLIAAIRALIRNNGEMTNAEHFINTFAQEHVDRRDDLWKRFMCFYETEYDNLAVTVTLPKRLNETMGKIVATGLKLVLASNPLFPRNVQMKRLAWTGLPQVPFELVTHIENMSFCKPRTEYYLEICRKINVPPEACIMIGNDPINDMTASHAGMKTYLTDDSKNTWRMRADAGEVLKKLRLGSIPEPDFKGPLSGVASVVQRYL